MLDSVFHEGARLWRQGQCYVSGQQKFYSFENNGKALSSKRTKHINIRYFFITDRVSKEEVLALWCPTRDMIGDYATKPLHWALFRKFRDQIMGVTPAQDPVTEKTDSGVRKQKQARPILVKAK
jgi:hypothetical protein